MGFKGLKGCLSSYGQQLGMLFLPLIILLKEVNPWLIVVSCVVMLGGNCKSPSAPL